MRYKTYIAAALGTIVTASSAVALDNVDECRTIEHRELKQSGDEQSTLRLRRTALFGLFRSYEYYFGSNIPHSSDGFVGSQSFAEMTLLEEDDARLEQINACIAEINSTEAEEVVRITATRHETFSSGETSPYPNGRSDACFCGND